LTRSKLKELRTEIEIQAPAEKVWQVLTELDKYPEWNPFICHAAGKAETGKTVDIDFQPDGKGLKLHCTVPDSTMRRIEWKPVTHPLLLQRAHFHHRTTGREQRHSLTGRSSTVCWSLG
jgi:hypothetical protein